MTAPDPIRPIVEDLKLHEGFVEHPYWCTGEVATIGYGCTFRDLTPSEMEFIGLTPEKRAEILAVPYDDPLPGDFTVTEKQAAVLLRDKAKRFYDDVTEDYPWTLAADSPEVRVVLTNMAFNLGRAGLRGFPATIGELETGDYRRASEEMVDSRWFEQVGERALGLAVRIRALVPDNEDAPQTLRRDLLLHAKSKGRALGKRHLAELEATA